MKLRTIAICLAIAASILTGGAVLHAHGPAQPPGAISTHVDPGGDNRFVLQDGAQRLSNSTGGTVSRSESDSRLSLQDGQTGRASGPASPADDALIARVAAQVLAHEDYAHTLSTDVVSKRMFDEYLDALDGAHLFFLQSDVHEFEAYRSRLEDMLLRQGDASPASKIFARFLERLNAQIDYLNQLLKTEKFTFTENSVYEYDRKTAPRPTDMDDARRLMKERIRYEYLQEKLNKKSPDEIVKILSTRYSRLSHAYHEYDSDDVLEVYLNALAHGYDPHSDYFGKSQLENFGIQMKLSFFGIGAMLEPDEDYVKVASLTPGGPAIKSGKLKPNDRITAVGQGDKPPVDITGMKINSVVELIRGPRGTQVKLTVIPADAADQSVRKTIVLTRDQVKLEEQEAKAKLIETPTSDGQTDRIGVIDLPSFYADLDSQDRGRKSATTDVAKLLAKLKQERVRGIILDLRNNGGGSLPEAISLTGLFIKAGPVVQVRDSSGEIRVDSNKAPSPVYDGPLIVLTNRLSASASEILAGALQDYGRALIVGDSSTFGKGTVQAVQQLNTILQQNGMKISADPGALKLTIQKFYRASGQSTQLKGVVPDLILPSMDDVLTEGERTLEYPLDYDTIDSAKYDKVNRIQPIVDVVRQRSQARIASDSDFAYLRQEIDIFKTLLAKKSVSMNEEERLKEKKEADARTEARKKALLARPAAREKVYLITLKQADQPGLPDPQPVAQVKKAGTAKATSPDSDLTNPASDDGVPIIDITLDETKRILGDMISLNAPRTTAQVNR